MVFQVVLCGPRTAEIPGPFQVFQMSEFTSSCLSSAWFCFSLSFPFPFHWSIINDRHYPWRHQMDALMNLTWLLRKAMCFMATTKPNINARLVGHVIWTIQFKSYLEQHFLEAYRTYAYIIWYASEITLLCDQIFDSSISVYKMIFIQRSFSFK